MIKQVKWEDLHFGDEVYIEGTRLGKIHYYGPHRVADPNERILVNSHGTRFRQYQNCLAREVKDDDI